MYKIRFNLGRGDNYRKWQIKTISNEKIHIDPKRYGMILKSTRLSNNKNASKKIHNGANKYPCAWIVCDDYELVDNPKYNGVDQILFNPKKLPYWTNVNGEDLDNMKFDTLYTMGNKIFQTIL